MKETLKWKPWEGVHAVPDLRMDTCPWCRKQKTNYFIVTYERSDAVKTELVCDTCSAAGVHFIFMHKAGLSRKQILEDFGFQEKNEKSKGFTLTENP